MVLGYILCAVVKEDLHSTFATFLFSVEILLFSSGISVVDVA